MGQTEGSAEASSLQNQLAQQQRELFDLGKPGVKLALGDLLKDLGKPGADPESIQKQFADAQAFSNKQFDYAQQGATDTLTQQAKQMGYRGDPRAVGSSAQDVLYNLEGMRRGNARQLNEMKTDASMQQRDFDLSQILGIGYGSMGQGFQGTQNALNLASMGTRNPWGSALSGAASGAATGASVGGVWGGVIGGVAGGALGYYS